MQALASVVSLTQVAAPALHENGSVATFSSIVTVSGGLLPGWHFPFTAIASRASADPESSIHSTSVPSEPVGVAVAERLLRHCEAE
ncbi:hypothetical protein [Homoserinimonas sp. A520]